MPRPEDYRSLELEAAAATAVARPVTTFGRLIRFGIPAGALAIAGWMVASSFRHGPSNMTTPDTEEFRTVQFPAPSLDAPRTRTEQGIIVLPPAPPPPPPVPVLQPQPPPARANDDEARRLAELERLRLEEERRKWERFRAPQVIADNSGAGAQPQNLAGENGGARTGADQETDPNRRFLASVSNAGVEIAKASKNERIDALVAQGTMIRGVLETALQSDLAGMVRAVTTEDVWSFGGHRILIPSGTRLVGEYKSGIAQGQTRVFVVWTRLLRSDGVSVQLGSSGTDDLGRAGNAGFVDNHYFERFGSAVLLSVVGGVSQFLAGFGQNSNSNSSGGTTITTTDPATGLVTTTQTGGNQNSQALQARQIATQNISQTLTNIAQEALKNSVNIPPTIHLDQGTRIIVFVRRDLDFSALYPDPVREALQEIKRERARSKPDNFPR